MKMDSTKATAFMAKEIHMEREQAFLVVRGVRRQSWWAR